MPENEIDILAMNIGGMTLREASSITFMQWIAKKLNGINAYSAASVELQGLISGPPMSRNMSEDRKIEIIGIMRKAGIEI